MAKALEVDIEKLKTSKNVVLLQSFIEYCIQHPEERFWQALRNWCGWAFVNVSDTPSYEIRDRLPKHTDIRIVDTYYWDKNEI